MLDRTSSPSVGKIPKPQFPWPRALELKEGISLFALDMGDQPVMKLELVFDSGSWYESQRGVAYFTAKMLQQGTQNKSAQAIAHCIDRYGASLHVQVQADICTIALLTLSKYLQPMLELLADIVLVPTFDEQRLTHLKNLTCQTLKINARKNDQVAYKKLKEQLFGIRHPYGQSLDESAIASITSAHLKQYHQSKLLVGCRLLVSGQVTEAHLQIIRKYLQPLPVQVSEPVSFSWSEPAPAQVHLQKKNSLQTAINIGRVLLLTKSHLDYLPLLVVNELLGGYFGSRLMRNIREEKGYTYGIFSSIVSLKHTCYLRISTEVNRQFAQVTCQEVEKEIRRLQDTLVPEEELAVVRNHMLGTFLATINDPFSVMEKFKTVHIHGLPRTYYKQLYDTVMHIDASRLRTLAQQYLSTNSLSRVMVG